MPSYLGAKSESSSLRKKQLVIRLRPSRFGVVMFVAKKQQQTCQALNLLKRAASIAIALPRTLPSLVIFLLAKTKSASK